MGLLLFVLNIFRGDFWLSSLWQ